MVQKGEWFRFWKTSSGPLDPGVGSRAQVCVIEVAWVGKDGLSP